MIGNNIELFSEWHEYAHEAVVDSFVYENCSHGVDTFTEFCTGWSGPGLGTSDNLCRFQAVDSLHHEVPLHGLGGEDQVPVCAGHDQAVPARGHQLEQ